MEQENNTITDVIDNSAITRYKHKLDAKFPIRERDLQNPSYSSLLGCLCTKILMVIVFSLFLLLHTLGYDGSEPMEDALSYKMILIDLAVGFGAYGLVSVFTYFYTRVKSTTVAFVLFGALVALIFAELAIWKLLADIGGAVAFPILVIIVCMIPFVMDVWGLATYGKHKPGQD